MALVLGLLVVPTAALAADCDKEQQAEASQELAQDVSAAQQAALPNKITSVEQFKKMIADVEGPVLLHVWATWCPTCRYDVAEVGKLKEKLGDDVTVISVSLDVDEKALQTFLEQEGIDYPVVRDPKMYAKPAQGLIGVPALQMFDASGKKVYQHYGRVDSSDPVLQKAVSGS